MLHLHLYNDYANFLASYFKQGNATHLNLFSKHIENTREKSFLRISICVMYLILSMKEDYFKYEKIEYKQDAKISKPPVKYPKYFDYLLQYHQIIQL